MKINIKNIDIIQTCASSPTQYEGTLEYNNMKFHVYIRYRWGIFKVVLGKISEFSTIEDLLGDFLGKNKSGREIISFEKEMGEAYDGIMDFQSVIRNLQLLVR